MDRQKARHTIKTLIEYNIPVHPDRARQLYEYAGFKIPKHLQKRELTHEERAQMEKAALNFMNALK